jgi:hypothetical protein
MRLSLRSLIPHLIAVGIFLLVTVIFCKPALESGVALKQGDITSWKAMSHQAFEYKEKHGEFPLWLPNMFSGMPAYQVAIEGHWSPLEIVDKVIQLGLPEPFNFFYLACICFYFLCICLGVRPYIAILGSLAFAFCSYSPIIITAGHNTKMLALAYAPAVMGAMVLVFKKNYFTGFVLMALLTCLQIGQGHQQITYYLLLIMLLMGISFLVYAIREKEMLHFFKGTGILIAAGLIGVACNALVLYTTYDYSKESKRGGQLVMDPKQNNEDLVKNGKTDGLSKSYAFQWSYGKAETWSLMFPGVLGYGSHQAMRDGEFDAFPQIKEDGPLMQYMNESLPQFPADQIAGQLSGTLYWGAQPFTNGPVYLGAIVCFLFLVSLFVLDNRHKWWILAGSLLGILMALGSNLPSFNYFLFDHFPLYNKFRVPTMALIIPQLLFPLGASLALNRMVDMETDSLKKSFRLSLIATTAVFVGIFMFYNSATFSKENKERTKAFEKLMQGGSENPELAMQQMNQQFPAETDNQVREFMASNLASQQAGIDPLKTSREFVQALRDERADQLKSDIMRSFIFVLIAAGLLFAYLKWRFNWILLAAGMGLLVIIDLLPFDAHYLNRFSFEAAADLESTEFPLTDADQQLMQDPDPNFRVMNANGLDEAKTSYYHKSIGGYHPAKLGIYDDLIAYQLSGQPNPAVMNMLNTKYVIQQQGDRKVAMRNPGALGNAWFVKGIQWVNGPAAEMNALNNLNPADSAVIDQSFKNTIEIKPLSVDSTAQIRLTAFDNDAIAYESKSSSDQLAVFSEIYYKDWQAYLDGKPVPHARANYVLRTMVVPAGTHKIEFKFEPASARIGKTISASASWLLTLLILILLIQQFRKKTPEEAPNA